MGAFLGTFGLKKILVVFFFLIMTLAMLWVKAFLGSMKAYEEGESSLRRSEFTRAVTYYDRSLHWYAPRNPYVEKSAQRLWEISEKAEAGGDIRLALIALRAIRGGFYSAGHLYQPGRPWIERCESKIEELLALKEARRGSSEGEGQRRGESGGEKGTSIPHVFWSLVVEAGFLGWIGSAIGFIVSAFPYDRSGKKGIRRPLTWSSLLGIFFSLWIIGMMKA